MGSLFKYRTIHCTAALACLTTLLYGCSGSTSNNLFTEFHMTEISIGGGITAIQLFVDIYDGDDELVDALFLDTGSDISFFVDKNYKGESTHIDVTNYTITERIELSKNNRIVYLSSEEKISLRSSKSSRQGLLGLDILQKEGASCISFKDNKIYHHCESKTKSISQEGSINKSKLVGKVYFDGVKRSAYIDTGAAMTTFYSKDCLETETIYFDTGRSYYGLKGNIKNMLVKTGYRDVETKVACIKSESDKAVIGMDILSGFNELEIDFEKGKYYLR